MSDDFVPDCDVFGSLLGCEDLWTGPDERSGQSMAWREQYVPRLYTPCVVDRLHDVTTEIKMPECVSRIHVDMNNSGRRYARVRGVFARDVFRGKDFTHADWLQHQCGWFG